MDLGTPNKIIRDGIPKGARLLHCYNPGDLMANGKIANGKEPNEKRGHHDAVPADMFFDNGGNIGISLDGQFIVVDFDTEGPLVDKEAARLPETWKQGTLRGKHHLFTVPKGWKGRNLKYIVTDETGRQVSLGDIKAKGYIVGPGSTRQLAPDTEPVFAYNVLDARDPVPAPDWLLERAVESEDAFEFTVDGVDGDSEAHERERIEHGRNDEELTRLAGFLRSRGFTAPAIEKMLYGVIKSGVLEQDEDNPYTRADAQRIARSAAKWVAGESSLSFNGGDRKKCLNFQVLPFDERDIKPINWLFPGVIPRNEFVLFEGKGDIGKSTAAIGIIAALTAGGALPDGTRKAPMKVLIVSNEDSLSVTTARLKAAGANLAMVQRVKCEDIFGEATLRIPDHVPQLRALRNL